MMFAGWASWFVALLCGAAALTMKTTVGADGAGIGEVANLQLLSSQTDLFILAVGFAIVGSIFQVGAAVIDRTKS